MSCWVAPSLAAQLWQIPLDQLWHRIHQGEIPTLNEDGFTFVDVAPYGPKVEPPNLPAHERPPTFMKAEQEPALSEDEAAALIDSVDESADAETAPVATATAEPSLIDEMGPEDETASAHLDDWRLARRKTGRTRIAPPRRPVAV